MDLAERHVVVTGASGALGGAVVDVLVERGAIVHAPMVEASPPASAVWLQSPRVLTKPGVDLADEEAVARYFAMLPSLWASVHLVGGFTMKLWIGVLSAESVDISSRSVNWYWPSNPSFRCVSGTAWPPLEVPRQISLGELPLSRVKTMVRLSALICMLSKVAWPETMRRPPPPVAGMS